MNITVHRGQNQIGGSIIEIASNTTRIILDTGAELDEEVPVAPQIDGLFLGQATYDAVFISHYHGDHLGLCDKILPEIPIYIGKGAADVTNAARRYLNKPEYDFAAYYEDGKSVCIGNISITPYLCDHSAFDSYMFYIVCEGKSLIYTGDFRSNGRKRFSRLLHRLPQADALIIEGTTLLRGSVPPKTEEELEQYAVNMVAKTDAPVFIVQAATNIDRLVTAYKVARRTNRVLMQDLYMAEIATAAGKSIPNASTFSGIRVFITHGRNGRHKALNEKYPNAKIGRAGVAKQRFLMCIRPSMQNYLEKLSEKVSFEGGILLYSMWNEYKENKDISDFLHCMEEKGVRIVEFHTSGHADEETIRMLVEEVNPDYIIQVHTENAVWFERFGECSVIYDGNLMLNGTMA